ncbi:hypothetical protein INT45_004721 [Circinella minor]|uniref:Uncharacterized protein n=1 Tax=Circinella minor TaxID=1195481 RepID=A0A8H7VUL4_9FUNG|nr:hypothetical protein INT45_004721 [Circinella minor]
MRYFGSLILMILKSVSLRHQMHIKKLGTDDEFVQEMPDYGIKRATKFGQLKSFHGYSFFGLDEMHCIGANVTRKRWDMITGNFSSTNVNSTIKLRRGPCSDIGTAIVDSGSTLPSRIFDGAFRVPTLVFEQLVEVSMVAILNKWKLLCLLHLRAWRLHIKNHMDHNLYTVNFHLLRHFPDIIEKLGPSRGYSTRLAERAIG